MDKCINFTEFMRYLLVNEGLVGTGAKIIRGLLEAQSPRLTIYQKRGLETAKATIK